MDRRDVPDCGLDIEGQRHSPGVRRFTHEAMATIFEVHVAHPDPLYAAQAAHAAFGLVDRLEGELTRFRPNSDIGRINHLSAGEGARVSPSTLECLVIARHVFDLTRGRFDISIGTGLPSLEFDVENLTVRATADGVRLDLGGIGKGYAVDAMADLLAEWGLAQALVHGGFSSVLALDPPAGQDGWPLTLSDPGDPSRVLVRLNGAQSALGASGMRKSGHIVEPRTGQPASGRRAAWVVVPRPRASNSATGDAAIPRATAVADALTTAFMLMPVDEIADLCDRSPGVHAWILDEPDGDPAGIAPLRHIGGA